MRNEDDNEPSLEMKSDTFVVPEVEGIVPYTNNESDKVKGTEAFHFLKGIQEDLRARGPLYQSDWGRPQNIVTVLNATIFAFVIQLIPSLIFAELIHRSTDGNLSMAETLLSSAVVGVIYAIFAGQPLVLLGITGPVALLLGTSYKLTETFNAQYFPFYFWTCFWAGLLHMISSMMGLVHLVWLVTPFTSQIFEFFIALTFIYSAVDALVRPIDLTNGGNRTDRDEHYANLMIGLITFYIAWTLHFAEQWNILSHQCRVFLSSYNTLIACVVATSLSFLPGIDLSENGSDGLNRVSLHKIPWDWQPTIDRPWMTDPFQGIDALGVAGAFIPGLMFFLLFMIDHNVSSILTQSPKYNLKKPPAFHWDFFILGVTCIPCAMLGLPLGNGLIPQAPLHCRALCTRQYVVDEQGVTREVVTHCEEQRWSALGQSLLMFVALANFKVISWIPIGCLFGLFLYLGVGAMHGNEIWERITFCFMSSKKRPEIDIVRHVKWSTAMLYTSIQAGCGFLVFAVAQFATVGYIYPALLAALVPIRFFVLPRVFSATDIRWLDPMDEPTDKVNENKRKSRHRNDSMGSEEIHSDMETQTTIVGVEMREASAEAVSPLQEGQS